MTGNFRAMYSRGTGVIPRYPYLNAKSGTIQGGHPVVLTTASAQTTASNPVARTLLAADVSAQYKEGSPIAGVLGFALDDAVTDSSGVAGTQFVYSAKAGAAEPRLSIPSYGMGQPADPNISYSEIMVAVAYPGVVYRGKLGGGGTTTASNVLLNTLAGIDIATGVFTVDTSETYKPLVIIGWDPSNTGYVFFEVLAAYCQALTGVNYSTQ